MTYFYFKKLFFFTCIYSYFPRATVPITLTDSPESILAIIYQAGEQPLLCDRRGLPQANANASQDSWHNKAFTSALGPSSLKEDSLSRVVII